MKVAVSFAILLLVTTARALDAPADTAATARLDSRSLYYEREITPADLDGRTLRELSLMRNWIFARAGNPFRRAWLRDWFTAQPWYAPRDVMDPSRLTDVDRRNADRIARYEVSLGREDLLQRRAEIERREALAPEDRVEIDLLNERLGEWQAREGAAPPTPLEDPTQLDRLLTLEQLADFSRRDLRLLRNLVYARRGMPFESELLQLWFARYAWYAPDPRYTDARLTAIDRRNVRIIRSLEDEIGGPLTDADERAWFGGA